MSVVRKFQRMAWLAGFALVLLGMSGLAWGEDPPDRVARLSYLGGAVSFEPAGSSDWVEANINRPLVTGDHLYSGNDGRAELEIGAATVRLDDSTAFNLINLDNSIAQMELTEGVLNLHVDQVFAGQSYEVDTPTLAFVVTQPGQFRIGISPDGRSTMVTVFDGSGSVYGENNASYIVRAGNAYRFHDSALRDYEVLDMPAQDGFDRWCFEREGRTRQSISRRYVSPEVIGYSDLDTYGSWDSYPEYGNVWFPTTVAVGWAPYRYGHWVWIDPWGWTWVDNAPWGFAPFHYGRWAYIGNRWGWCPGPIGVRPVYAPAMVAFFGGGVGVSVSFGSGPVGWFPLGPRDIYVPWYSGSRNYFRNINVTNVRNTTIINNTYITNVYNNYAAGRPLTNVKYAYRQNVTAVTAVPRNVFVGARPVAAARVEMNRQALTNARVVSRVGIAPVAASAVAATAVRAKAMPAVATRERTVIARTAPPPRVAPLATRITAIEKNGGRPLPTNQLRKLDAQVAPPATAANREATRVRVVANPAAKPQPLPMRGNLGKGVATESATRPSANGPAARPVPGQVAKPEGPRGVTAPRETTAPGRANGALPSARFAPHPGVNAPSRNAVNPAPVKENARAATPPRSTGTAPRNATESRTGGDALPSARFAPHAGSGQTERPASTAPRMGTRNVPSSNVNAPGHAAPKPHDNSPQERGLRPDTNGASSRNEPAQYRGSYRAPPPRENASTPRYEAPKPRANYSAPNHAPPQPRGYAPSPRNEVQAPPRPNYPAAISPQPHGNAPAPRYQAPPRGNEGRAPPPSKGGHGNPKDNDNDGHHPG